MNIKFKTMIILIFLVIQSCNFSRKKITISSNEEIFLAEIKNIDYNLYGEKEIDKELREKMTKIPSDRKEFKEITYLDLNNITINVNEKLFIKKFFINEGVYIINLGGVFYREIEKFSDESKKFFSIDIKSDEILYWKNPNFRTFLNPNSVTQKMCKSTQIFEYFFEIYFLKKGLYRIVYNFNNFTKYRYITVI